MVIQSSVLSWGGQVALPELDQPFHPKMLADTFWLWPGTKERFVDAVQRVEALPVASAAFFSLDADARDADIRGELPVGFPWEISELGASLCIWARRQLEGLPGPLLATGFANNFYTQDSEGVFVVSMRWFKDKQPALAVYKTPQLGKGARIFSRSLPLDSLV